MRLQDVPISVGAAVTGEAKIKRATFGWRLLQYITNNEAQSRHEEVFDFFFWIVETIALIVGVWVLFAKHSAEWIPFLVIEYCWAMDNLRHNRP